MQLTPDVVEGFVKTILSSKFDQAVQSPPFHREAWEYCCSKYPKVAISAPRG